MKKWTYHHTFLLLIGLIGLFLLLMGCLSLSGTTLYVGFAPPDILIFFACCLICALALVWLTVWQYRKAEKRWLRILLVVLLILALLIISLCLFLRCAFSPTVGYRTYISDDGMHTIVVEWTEFLFSSWGSVYEKTSPITMKLLGSYRLDDVYPVDNFAITWNSTSFVINFGPESQTYEYLKGD